MVCSIEKGFPYFEYPDLVPQISEVLGGRTMEKYAYYVPQRSTNMAARFRSWLDTSNQKNGRIH